MKSLRKPLNVDVDGVEYTLLTVGYVAHVLRRSRGTVKLWTPDLVPAPLIILNPDEPRLRRGLYLKEFIDALEASELRAYLGKRLDRDLWQCFQRDVLSAYEQTVVPLIASGVMKRIREETVRDRYEGR